MIYTLLIMHITLQHIMIDIDTFMQKYYLCVIIIICDTFFAMYYRKHCFMKLFALIETPKLFNYIHNKRWVYVCLDYIVHSIMDNREIYVIIKLQDCLLK